MLKPPKGKRGAARRNLSLVKPDGWVTLDDARVADVLETLAANFDYRAAGNKGLSPYALDVRVWIRHVLALSATHHADPFEEYLADTPEHDGENWFARYYPEAFGITPDNNPGQHSPAYLEHAARLQFLAPVGRCYEPGAEASTMPVLIGDEELGKSRSFSLMFTDKWQQHWFNDTVSFRDRGKELVERMAGSVVGEISELNHLHNRSLEDAKSFIASKRESGVRLAYGHLSDVYNRRWGLVGTANDLGSGVLPDDVTNRRFWPVRIPDNCDFNRVVAWIEKHRDQLWAQAMAEYWAKPNGNDAWANPRSLLAEAKETARIHAKVSDSVMHILASINELGDMRVGATMIELLYAVSAFGPTDKDLPDGKRGKGPLGKTMADYVSEAANGRGKTLADQVGVALKHNGWKNSRKRLNGTQAQRWYPPGSP